jgi:hypothetical protein
VVSQQNPGTRRPPAKKAAQPQPPLAKVYDGPKITVQYPEPIMQEAYEATVRIHGHEPDFPKSWKE